MIGTVLGNYRLRSEIGRGGMGAVYVADHLHLARQVALKLLLPELCTDPEAVRRLFQEARATSLIRHAGIVEIFDCDAPRPDAAFLVMELLAGESLGTYLKRVGALPACAAAIELAAQIADAIRAAHDVGIFHRDLKPDNVFLVGRNDGDGPRQIKILDFGIAKLTAMAGSSGRTRTGALVGTPFYMSPEQCRGTGTVDHRTDIYSFGCLLFDMWCGRPPFVYEGTGELLVAHLSEAPPDPRTFAPGLTAPLAELMLSCLQKDAAARPQSMRDLVGRLRKLEAEALHVRLPALAARDFASEIPWQPGAERSATNIAAVAPMRGVVGQENRAPVAAVPAQAVAAARPGLSSGRSPGTTPAAAAASSDRQSAAEQPAPTNDALAQAPRRTPSETTLGQTASEMMSSASPLDARGPARHRRIVWISALLGLSALAALAYAITKRSGSSSASSPATSQDAALGLADAATNASAKILLEVDNAPPGLAMKVDGAVRSVPVELPQSNATHVLDFSAPGFKPYRLTVDAKRSRVITLTMSPDAPAAVSSGRTPAPSLTDTAATTTGSKASGSKTTGPNTGSRDRARKEDKSKTNADKQFRRFDDI